MLKFLNLKNYSTYIFIKIKLNKKIKMIYLDFS
jgi:hypothetical protein